jgi:hypothetical protein
MTTRVCVGVPTYLRNGLLRDALLALAHLSAPPETFIVQVAVFDNDPLGGAAPVVSEIRPSMPFPIAYVHVPLAGLSNVRNAALSFAGRHADLLAMLDDDEQPEPQWLNELLRMSTARGAAVVVGPVNADLPADAPAWIRAFRECEYPRLRDGESLSDGWSSNFLLDLRQIAGLNLTFDVTLNRIGGEDQLFFRRMLAHGRIIRYAANATVWETLPPARRSLGAILKRSFRRGGSLTMCDRTLRGGFGTMLRRGMKGGGLILLSSAKLGPILLLRGVSPAILLLCEIARGAGMLAAFAGLEYQAYRARAA